MSGEGGYLPVVTISFDIGLDIGEDTYQLLQSRLMTELGENCCLL